MRKSLLLLFIVLSTACRPIAPTKITPAQIPCWGGQGLGSFGRTELFCERIQPRCVGQPANTWSNAAYLLAALGIGMSRLRRRDARPAGPTDRAFRILLIVACVYLAIGSALYHASVVRWAEVWDMSGSYGVVLTLLGYSAVRIIGPERPAVVTAGVLSVLGVQVPATLLKFHVEDFIVFPAAVLLLALSMGVLQRQGRAECSPLLTALGATLLGCAVWVLDVKRLVCAPDSLLQGHAVWHAITALAIVCAWRSLRGGRP